MNWWQRFQHWITTGEGIAALIASTIALFVTVKKFWVGITRGFRRVCELLKFAFSIDRKHDAVIERLNALDRGQLDQIQVRAALMDADERTGFFRCDAKGKCIWVSELWRNITGLSTEEAAGYGWEMGIADDDRARVVQNWQLAIDHSRRYQDTVKYMHKINGKTTQAKVIATPVRDNDGTILSWTGIAKPIQQ